MTRTSKRLSLAVQYGAGGDDLPARRLLRKWVTAALDRSARMTVRFVDAPEGQALNRAYRGVDHPTNVLAFVYDDDGDVACGDVILCLPVLRREALEQRKPLVAHCAHLVVHGVLHVQGYDHAGKAEARVMESRETAVLSGLGFGDPYAYATPTTA